MYTTDRRENTNHNASVPLALPEAHRPAVVDPYTFMEDSMTGCSASESMFLIVNRFRIMLETEGCDSFDFVGWFRKWLDTPQRSLGYAKPVSYLNSHSGRQLLLDQISMLQSGAYV